MKKILFLAAVLLFPLMVNGQNLNTLDPDEDIIPMQLVEEKPSFQGGDLNTFSKWVNEHIVYQEKFAEATGRVTLKFIVAKDGSVVNVKVLRGVDPLLDKEAVRVVSSSPKWEPGKQRGQAVNVEYTFSVIFRVR